MTKFRLAAPLITAFLCMNSGHALDVIQIATIDIDIDPETFLAEELYCNPKKAPTYEKVEKIIAKSSRCKKDSDCTTFFVTETQSPFGCMTIPVHKDKISAVSEAINRNHCLYRGSCFLRSRCHKNMALVFCIKGSCSHL